MGRAQTKRRRLCRSRSGACEKTINQCEGEESSSTFKGAEPPKPHHGSTSNVTEVEPAKPQHGFNCKGVETPPRKPHHGSISIF